MGGGSGSRVVQPCQHSSNNALPLHLKNVPPLSSTIQQSRGDLYAVLGIDQSDVPRGLIPITLRTSLTAWPRGLQALVRLQHRGGDGHA